MELYTINAGQLRKCFLAGAALLDANKELVNELNVFPVPDGDTGTNMTMTIMSAVSMLEEADPNSMDSVCRAISGGSLRGARGNSGVILSQLLRGFCKQVRDSESIDPVLLAQGFRRAVDTAYKAVMKPKEGTILTVARGLAEKAEELALQCEELTEMAEKLADYGDEVLDKTPEMLPVLKEAGVVDSGGKGLMFVIRGALAALKGEEIAFSSYAPAAKAPSARISAAGSDELSTADIKFGYCTEFIINTDGELPAESVEDIKSFLLSIGDSLVCVADDGLVKIHVHTNHPGQAFEKGLEYGSLSRMKVDNMREEHNERLIQNASKIAKEQADAAAEEKASPEKQPHKDTAFIAVSAGKGLSEIFRSIGASYVIEGGQTMNPSADDMLKAVDLVNADVVYILPNNKNIILAAEQAARINKDVKIIVVPTKTIPQGITALISHNPELGPEDDLEVMKECIGRVKTGELTYAVRNTSIGGKEIREGDIMGIGDRGILAVGEILNTTALEMVRNMTDDDTELITVYCGADVTDEDGAHLRDSIAEAYPDCDVDLQRGDQPVYYYIISAE